MLLFKNIAVYCGSNFGLKSEYSQQAYLLGAILAQKKIGLVYGGGKVGLMKSVADGVIENNGNAIGVLPRFLDRKELAHEGLTKMILVDTMHERKYRMSELSDAIIALPGGFGTMDELFEMLTWEQLGLHKKPIGLLNINGFYNPLIAFIQNMVDEGFVKEEYMKMLIVHDRAPDLLEQMYNYQPPSTGKWI